MTILKCKLTSTNQKSFLALCHLHCQSIKDISILHCSLVYVDQDLFTEMDVEEDGNVYIKQVVVTLKALNKDIDHNLKVWHMFSLH